MRNSKRFHSHLAIIYMLLLAEILLRDHEAVTTADLRLHTLPLRVHRVGCTIDAKEGILIVGSCHSL